MEPLRGVVVSFWIAAMVSGVASARPSLIVVVVADQMRADYLPRFSSEFVPSGLLRLMREGADYTQAAYDYGATKTAPGHALIGSGTYPVQNGILGNEWFDRVSGHSVTAADPAPSIDGRTALRWFLGPSLATRIHAVYPRARVYGVSYKDRSALLLGGPGQDDAFWWDTRRKAFRSYGPAPTWLDQAGKIPPPSSRGDRVDASIEAFTERLIEAESLGANSAGAPDILTVSFSQIDIVGHAKGPDSEEIHRAVLNMDRQVAALLALLERRLPREQMLWVFTADHGVTPIPEEARRHGKAAGRVRFPLAWMLGRGLVKAVSPPYVYIDPDAARAEGLSLPQAEERLRQQALAWEGVEAVYTREAIAAGQAPEAVRRSVYPARSGDLYIVLKPGYIFSEEFSGTTHGQPTPDDQRVPLLIWGDHLVPQKSAEVVSPARIAPTVLDFLEIPAPDLQKPLPLARKISLMFRPPCLA